jgi:hypothetical protein
MWQVKAIFAVAAAGAFLGADFMMGNAARPAAERLSFAAYLASWADAAGDIVPQRAEVSPVLAAALPAAPAGWKRQPAAAGDAAALLVPEAQAVLDGGGDAPGADARRLAAVGGPRDGVQAAAATYTRGRNSVVVELVRHPDAVITDPAQMPQKMALAGWVMDEGGARIGVLGGMPLWQARVVPGLGAKMAIGAVGGQVQLRVVYPERMDEDRLVEVLQGLDVAALNAAVVEPDAAIAAAAAAAAQAAVAEDARVAAAETAPEPPPVMSLPERRGGKSDLTLGIGTCEKGGAGKFCAVGE